MEYLNGQAKFLRAAAGKNGVEPFWADAIERVRSRCEALVPFGLQVGGLEAVACATEWIEFAGMTPEERRTQVGNANDFPKWSREQRHEYYRRAMLESLICSAPRSEDAVAQMVWARILVDGIFAYGSVLDEEASGRPERGEVVRGALAQLQRMNVAEWVAIALHVELTSAWSVRNEADVHEFFGRLVDRYGSHFDSSLAWTPDGPSWFGVICALAVNELEQDAISFSDFVATQAPGVGLQNVDEIPGYRAFEAFWDRFIGRSWLEPAGWFLGQVTVDVLTDANGLGKTWKRDERAYCMTNNLAAQRKANRLRNGDVSRLPVFGLPSAWPSLSSVAMASLFNGPAEVSFGWLMVQHEDEPQAGFDGFNGQQNGLIGALKPGVLTLNTGLAHGAVHLSLSPCDGEPAMPPEAWEEVVEVSLVVPKGAAMRVENLEGDFQEPLALAAGTYRVRVAAARYGQQFEGGDRDEIGEPMERYALAFWPDAVWRPDAVLRRRHAGLMLRHQQAQASML